MCGECGCGEREEIAVHKHILEDNVLKAEENRRIFNSNNILSINVMGSPGSGKTTLIEVTASSLTDINIGVIEGDLETSIDAERLKGKCKSVVQITTGNACHLDADMINKALESMPLGELDILFIENVGNLVCPALYDLGEHIKVVILSTTEGEDKPLKYPVMFKKADAVVITKYDLADVLNFDLEKVINNIKKVNKRADIVVTSYKNPESWINFLKGKIKLAIPS